MVVFQVYRRSASKAAVCERVLHDVGAIHEVLPAFAPKVQRAQICNWRYSTALTAVFCDWHFSVEAAQFPTFSATHQEETAIWFLPSCFLFLPPRILRTKHALNTAFLLWLLLWHWLRLEKRCACVLRTTLRRTAIRPSAMSTGPSACPTEFLLAAISAILAVSTQP